MVTDLQVTWKEADGGGRDVTRVGVLGECTRRVRWNYFATDDGSPPEKLGEIEFNYE